jgi:hypothetical protein
MAATSCLSRFFSVSDFGVVVDFGTAYKCDRRIGVIQCVSFFVRCERMVQSLATCNYSRGMRGFEQGFRSVWSVSASAARLYVTFAPVLCDTLSSGDSALFVP